MTSTMTANLQNLTHTTGFAPAGSRPAAAPDRFAILPPGIPHDEPASPARFLLDSGSFKRCAPAATTAPAAPSQLAFQTSQADGEAIKPRGQGRRKQNGRGHVWTQVTNAHHV